MLYNLSEVISAKRFSHGLCLNGSVMQVGVFPKAKTGKHKGEIKTHQRRKNWKAKKSKQKPKNKYSQKVHLKTSCDNPLGN
jgi:hypothetical protein